MLRALVLGLAALNGAATAFHTSLAGPAKTPWDVSQRKTSLSKRDDVDPALLYPAYNLSVPVDHFHNESKYAPHSKDTFPLRYWFDATCYQPGGPVVILQGGETSGADRLAYLQKGLLRQLIETTHGIGVILEHRYYGTSFPVEDLSTKNLRFLTTQQALADEAYFAEHIQFPGLEKYGDLTSKTTAYLGYGGSYAGAFNALLRVIYPDVFWGTISSSGVTKAIYDYWAYYEPIAEFGPPDCIEAQKTIVHIADKILIGKNDSKLTSTLKQTFGYGDVTYDDDFGNVLGSGITNWQSLNWDPAVTDDEVYRFCANVTDPDIIYPATESLRKNATELIKAADYNVSTALVTQMLNFIGYLNLTSVAPCAASGATQDECFTSHNATFYAQDDIEQDWRSWPYQYCTEWGFLQTGSGVPADQLPLVSRLVDLEYMSIICQDAFNITTPPDVEIINQYGGFDISYPRLAIIDGQWDPWRLATPHAFGYGAKPRKSTASEPFIEIEKAVHHWDENALFPNETTATLPPLPVADTQKNEIMFVQEWMQEWQLRCLIMGGCS